MRTGATRTHYETLGVTQHTTADEIRAAYRTQIRQVHPDVAGPDGAARAAELSAAYAVLSRPDQRRLYDESLQTGPPQSPDEEFADFEADWGTPGEWDTDDQPHQAPAAEETLDDVVFEDVEISDVQNARFEEPDGSRPFGWVQPRTGPVAEPQLQYPARRLIIYAASGLAMIIATGLWACLSWTSGGWLTRSQTAGVAIGAAVIGLLIGYVLHHRVPLGPIPAAIGSVAVVVVGEISAQQPLQSTVRLLYVLALAIALGLLLQERLRSQKRLNAVLPIKTLRRNNVFGSLSGEVAADLLERGCDPLYSIVGLRIVRNPAPDALFTHVFVCGTKVAFARAVVADGGLFRWSGPTLFRDGAGGWPTEVLKGTYEEAARQLPSVFGKGTEIRSWILVYPPDRADVQQAPDALMPSIQSAEQAIDAIGRYLTSDNEVTLVDQQRVVTAADALYG